MAEGSMDTLRNIISADPDCKLAADCYAFYVSDENEDALKKRALVKKGGKTECAYLVQEKAKVPPASLWIQGPPVKGNKCIPYGTIIASGWVDGKYPNNTTGQHAAILIREEKTGLLVADQFNNIDTSKPYLWPTRILRWEHTKTSNRGNSFCVVITQKMHKTECS